MLALMLLPQCAAKAYVTVRGSDLKDICAAAAEEEAARERAARAPPPPAPRADVAPRLPTRRPASRVWHNTRELGTARTQRRHVRASLGSSGSVREDACAVFVLSRTLQAFTFTVHSTQQTTAPSPSFTTLFTSLSSPSSLAKYSILKLK